MEQGWQSRCNLGGDMWCLDASPYLDGRGCKVFLVLQTLPQGTSKPISNPESQKVTGMGRKVKHHLGMAFHISLEMTSWKSSLLILGRPQTPPHYPDDETRVCRWSPGLQKCLLNWWKKGWAKTERKRSCLSSEKGDGEEVDTASLFLSWAGDIGLAGKKGPELREKSQRCWREDRRVLLANSSRAAHEPQASTRF